MAVCVYGNWSNVHGPILLPIALQFLQVRYPRSICLHQQWLIGIQSPHFCREGLKHYTTLANGKYSELQLHATFPVSQLLSTCIHTLRGQTEARCLGDFQILTLRGISRFLQIQWISGGIFEFLDFTWISLWDFWLVIDPLR